ncbi:MAG TPA: TonB-dependent receptor [Vicinamibacterales bacterium]|nr:TonB-dependent receptor [Vicinamibacterales bacterium]
MTNSQRTWRRCAALMFCAVVLVAPSARAQVFTGRIDVTVTDSTGAVLPGVTIEAIGAQNQNTTTDAKGEAHLLNLPSGTYQVRAALQGFANYLNRAVPVSAGSVIPLRVTLGVQGVAEQVQVSAEVPIVEPKRQAISTNITNQELQNIPTARDPWVVLQTVPGVIVDRVNVGGSESGQQSNYIAKGATTGDNTWYMDGIPITDMSALGSSPSYYDFDMFQEMQVTTGGTDARQATPGVQMNFVLKSGTNTPHGSARTYYENKRLQGNNLPSDLVEALGGTSGKGNRLNKYADYGGELGGPVVRDRLWGWASFGRTDVNTQTLAGVADKTKLTDVAAKLQAAFSKKLRGNFTFFSGNKEKDGRGAGPFNPPETTWIQNGPSKMYKGEIDYVASSSLFLTARGAHVNGPFTLTPKGGLDNGQVFLDSDGVFHNSNLYSSNDRPQIVFNGDGNWFRGRHEVRFGTSVRNYTDDTILRYAGDFLDVEIDPNGTTIAIPIRPYHQVNRALYTSAYVGDTLTMDRLTLNGSVRFDRATSSVDAITVSAHPVVPDILPGVSAPEIKNAVVWNTLSPRAGATYALGGDRKTLARVSYSAFASQLAAPVAGNISSAGFAYAYYLAVDSNHNFNIEPGELRRFLFAKNILPDNPTKAVNQIDPGYSAPRTHEVTFGVDRELFTNFGVSAAYTWRRYVNQLWNVAPPIGATSADYVEDGRLTGTLPDGSTYDVPYYALSESAAPEGAGTLTANRDGYHRSFNGVEFAATKRLSNRWMGRFGYSWNRSREYFDDPSKSIVDPTPLTSDPLRNGGLVTVPTAGSGKSQIYLTLPSYQFTANGFYQGPWGVNVGGNLIVRQGYTQMFFSNDVSTNDPVYSTKDILVIPDKVGKYRLPAVKSLDARVEKLFTFQRTEVAFDVDVFNVLNSGTVLGRIYDVSSTKFNQVAEIMNPRIARFGLRIQF